MINPQELKNTEFSKGFKGYTCAEVDKYVDYVVEQFTELCRENAELEKKLRVLTAKLEEAKSEQDSISATIVNAQKMADEIIRDANEKANAINSAIHESFDDVLAQYRSAIEREQKNLLEAQKNAIDFKNGILGGYKQQVKLLCELIPPDSMEEANIKSVDEVVQSTVAAAGAKIRGDRSDEPEAEMPEHPAE